jgi:ABC-2 type transport system ATP-binding protein
VKEKKELFQIGEVAELTGLSRRTLRYYEELGLLKARSHGPGKFRIYTREDIERINRIKRLKENLGFSLQQAKEGIERDDERKKLMDSASTERSPAAKRKALERARVLLLDELDMVSEKRRKLADIERRPKEHVMGNTDNGYDLEVERLCKNFGDLEAVKEVSFNVTKGEIFGFLGPNGAGKSTTIRMLCTLLQPTSGSAKVAGYDIISQPAEVRTKIGLVAEKIIIYDRLTALENLYFFGRMNHLPEQDTKKRSELWLERLGMSEWSKKMAGTFSTGMKQRVNIARALLTQPEIMFLDEPTLGLDPQTTRSIRQFISELAESGITVILTTHQMAEAEALCDRISIIDQGHIVALDTAANLKKIIDEGQGGVLEVRVDGLNQHVLQALQDLEGVRAVAETEGETLKITTEGSGVVRRVVDVVEENGGTVESLNTHEANLEDVFLHLTGTEMRAEVSNFIPTGRAMPGRKSRRVR